MATSQLLNGDKTDQPQKDHIFFDLLELTSGMLRVKIGEIRDSGIPIIKNNKKSEELRLEGNQNFKMKNYELALNEFTKSLYFAEKDSLEQKLAYANRSAVLLQKGYYAQCLEDIDRALKDDIYPKDKIAKMLDRQKTALGLIPTQKTKQFHVEVGQLKNKNPNIPSASSKLKISENEKYGKYIEATEDIKLGETLLIEQPYVFSVNKNNLLRYCSACGELCFNMIPCDNCFELYCSDKCKTKSFEQYHRYECLVNRYYVVYPSLYDTHPKALENSNSRIVIPLRITLKALKDIQEKKHEQAKNQYHSDCYEEVKNLVTHKDIFMLSRPDNQFYESSEMVKIFYILTTYSDIKDHFGVDDTTLKDLLIHNGHVTHFNTAEVLVLDRNLTNVTRMFTAVGLYPVFTRFNHSCHPNIIYHYYGSTVVARAMRSIKKGEQCFTCYTSVYYGMKREIRQQTLDEFFFVCDCKACEENWPLLETNPETEDLCFSASTKKYPCNKKYLHKMKELYLMLCTGKISRDHYGSTVWPMVSKIYEKIKNEEPSITLCLLDAVLEWIFPQRNTLCNF